jgi:tRNA(Phe) wybutosine-synthesizing methylase Tyw3
LNYETDLEEMRIRTHVLENKYHEWQKILIEPLSVNNAKMFSFESRLNEEEELRIKEYNYLRELMKKLIYSLEQHQTQGSLDEGTLPTLINQKPDAEIVTLKRFNFLK